MELRVLPLLARREGCEAKRPVIWGAESHNRGVGPDGEPFLRQGISIIASQLISSYYAGTRPIGPGSMLALVTDQRSHYGYNIP